MLLVPNPYKSLLELIQITGHSTFLIWARCRKSGIELTSSTNCVCVHVSVVGVSGGQRNLETKKHFSASSLLVFLLINVTVFTFGPQFSMLSHWSGSCVFSWIWWPSCFQWSMVKMTLGDFSRLLKTINSLPPSLANAPWGPETWYVSSPTAQRLPSWEKAPANMSGPHTKVLGSQERQIFNQSWVAP